MHHLANWGRFKTGNINFNSLIMLVFYSGYGNKELDNHIDGQKLPRAKADYIVSVIQI